MLRNTYVHENSGKYELLVPEVIKILEGSGEFSKILEQCKVKQDYMMFFENVDAPLGQWSRLVDQLMSQQLRYNSKSNLLYHLSQIDSPGISIPQLYIKTKDVYTPLHQQNLSLESINLNLGPSSSQWFYIQPEFNQQFVQYANGLNLSPFKYDQALWLWPSESITKEKVGFEVKKYTQKAGSLILTRPGTFHWVIGSGYAIHYSYNLFKPTMQQLQASITRKNNIDHAYLTSLGEITKNGTQITRNLPFLGLLLNLPFKKKNFQQQIPLDFIEKAFQLVVKEIKSEQSTAEANIFILKDKRIVNFGLHQSISFCEVCQKQIICYGFAYMRNFTDWYCCQCFIQFIKTSEQTKNKLKQKKQAKNNEKVTVIVREISLKVEQSQQKLKDLSQFRLSRRFTKENIKLLEQSFQNLIKFLKGEEQKQTFNQNPLTKPPQMMQNSQDVGQYSEAQQKTLIKCKKTSEVKKNQQQNTIKADSKLQKPPYSSCSKIFTWIIDNVQQRYIMDKQKIAEKFKVVPRTVQRALKNVKKYYESKKIDFIIGG